MWQPGVAVEAGRAREQEKEPARATRFLPSASSCPTDQPSTPSKIQKQKTYLLPDSEQRCCSLSLSLSDPVFAGTGFSSACQTHNTTQTQFLSLLFSSSPSTRPNPTYLNTTQHEFSSHHCDTHLVHSRRSSVLAVGFRLPSAIPWAYSVCSTQPCIPTLKFLPLHRRSSPFASAQLLLHIAILGIMPYPKPISEPIAVVGVSCRFAGGVTTPSRLWQLLQNPKDLTQEVPSDRFNIDVSLIPRASLQSIAAIQIAT